MFEKIKKEKVAFIFSVLMIVFGIAEIRTGFRHEFFGLTTTQILITSIVSFTLGSCYMFSGIFLMVLRKWSLSVSFVLLIVDVIGRLLMMFSGMYPMDSALQTFAMITGTTIAALFGVYVFIKRKKL